MPYTKILFKPGIDRKGLSLTAENGWFDGNLVRFRKGFPEKIEVGQKILTQLY